MYVRVCVRVWHVAVYDSVEVMNLIKVFLSGDCVGVVDFCAVDVSRGRVSNLKMKVCKTSPLQYFCKGPVR